MDITYISKINVKSVYFSLCPLLLPSQSHCYFSCDCCQSILYLLLFLAQKWLCNALWIKPSTLSQWIKPYRAWTLSFSYRFYLIFTLILVDHYSVIFLFPNIPNPFRPLGLYICILSAWKTLTLSMYNISSYIFMSLFKRHLIRETFPDQPI